MSERNSFILRTVIFVIIGALYGFFLAEADNRVLAAVILGLFFGAFPLVMAFLLWPLIKKIKTYTKRKRALLGAAIFSVMLMFLHYILPPYIKVGWRGLLSSVIFGVFMFIIYLFILAPLIEKERENREKKIGGE